MIAGSALKLQRCGHCCYLLNIHCTEAVTDVSSMVDKHAHTCCVCAACLEQVTHSTETQIIPQVPTPVPRLLGGCSALPDHVQLGIQADAHLVGRRLLEGCSVAERAQHRGLHQWLPTIGYFNSGGHVHSMQKPHFYELRNASFTGDGELKSFLVEA